MPKSILVIDDEPNISRSLQFLMSQAGYDVSTVSDGEEALNAIKNAPPDLILLDVNVPKRNGFELCERIRANELWAHIRIVMLTAKDGDIEKEQGLALGADDFITKPFSTQEVVAKVKEMLNEP